MLARDPTNISSGLWPRQTELTDYWTSEDGREYIDKWFSTDKILKYFRTRSTVGDADVADGCSVLCNTLYIEGQPHMSNDIKCVHGMS